MEKRTRQFGGEHRVHLPDDILENIADVSRDRLNDDELEAVDIIKEGFDLLSEAEREVMVLLLSANNMTYKRIGKILNSTENNVKQLVHKAKKKLLEYVNQNADGSIYIEGMLKRMEDDKDTTKQRTTITRKAGKS